MTKLLSILLWLWDSSITILLHLIRIYLMLMIREVILKKLIIEYVLDLSWVF